MKKPRVFCNARPVRCQAYGYLSGRRASPPIDRCQIYCLVIGLPGCGQLATSCRLSRSLAATGARTHDLVITSPPRHPHGPQTRNSVCTLICWRPACRPPLNSDRGVSPLSVIVGQYAVGRLVVDGWILTKQEMTGWQWHQLDYMQIVCASLQTDNHASASSLNFFAGRVHFLTPSQQ